MRTTVLIRQVKTITEVPIIIARDPAKFGHTKIAKKLPHKVVPNKPPLKSKLNIIPDKPKLKAKKSPPRKIKPERLKWWDGLSRQEQQIYVKSHPKTNLKVSKKARDKHNVQTENPATPADAAPTPDKSDAPQDNTTVDTAPKHKLTLHDILRAAKKTFSQHDLTKIFSSSGKLKQSLDDAPESVKETIAQTEKIKQSTKEKPLPEPEDAEQATQQLFGHLADESNNKIISHISKHLSAKDKAILGQAMEFAGKHPEEKNPPHKFRKVLGRTLLFALTAGVGAVLLGPAGVLLAVDGFNQFKNKTGESLPKFAWKALSGQAIDEAGVQKEQEDKDEASQYDKTEAPIVKIIKGLKAQLKQIEGDEKREPIKNLIEELGERLSDYQDYEKDDDETVAPVRKKSRKRR